MLVTYLDDSGSNKEGPVMVLAGWSNRFTQWINFSEEWQALLDETPKLRYFKLKEAFRCEEQFGRFTPKERDTRALKFFSLVERYMPIGIVASLWWKDIETLKTEYSQKADAYQIVFHGVMSTIVQLLASARINERMLFVFDVQGRAGRIAEATYNHVRPRLPGWAQARVIGTSHVDDEEIVPLQAADSLAWLMRRHAEKNPNCERDLADWRPTEDYLQPLRKLSIIHTSFPLQRLRPMMEYVTRD